MNYLVHTLEGLSNEPFLFGFLVLVVVLTIATFSCLVSYIVIVVADELRRYWSRKRDKDKK